MEEVKIPVFSVLKKGTTLKNIFLNSPPQEFRKPSSPSTENDPILIGRHPNCHIIVDHPSISRFHLEVRPKPTLRKLFITDCSSVHGTWVSGKKILPNIPIELIEGDTVRLGASSRIYRLHWMPLSHAFEMEKPMSPLLEEEVLQDEKLSDACFSYVIPSAPPLPEIMNSPSPGKLFFLDSERDGQSLIRKEIEEESSCFSSIAPLLESVSSPLPMEESEASENFLANEMKLKREERSALSPMTSDKRDQSSSLLSRRNKSIRFLQIEKASKAPMGDNRNSVQRELQIEEQGIVAFGRGRGEDKFLPVLLSHGTDEEKKEEESLATERSKGEEQSAPRPLTSDKRDQSSSLLSRRNKSIRFLQIKKTGKATTGENRNSVQREVEIEEQGTVAFEGGYGEKFLAVPLAHGADEDDKEEDSFVSDKENMTPLNSMMSKALKSNREIVRSPLSALRLFNLEEGPSNSDNENLTPESLKFVKTIEPKSGIHFMKEKEESKFSDANDLEQLSSSFKSQKSLFKQERSALVGNKILNAQEFSNSHNDIETSKSSKHLKSNNHKSRSCWMKEKEESKGSGANDLKQLFASGVKLQRSLFKPERLPMDENKSMNVEEDIFHSDMENWTPEVPKSLKAQKALARDLLKIVTQEDEAFVSDKEESKGANDLEQLFSSEVKLQRSQVAKKSKGANDLEQLFSSEVKLQRSLFRPEQSPVCENIVLNVEEDRFLSDQENWSPEVSKSLKSEKAFTSDLLKVLTEKDEEFVSDKENLTPQTSRSTKSKKLPSESRRKFEEETMEKRKERLPFQPLFESSPLRKSSSACHVQVQDENGCSTYANNVHNSEEKTSDNQHMDELPHMPVRERKKWYLIVDVGCFLNEESRKSLQLLEGIRGTQLIIPRIVIRELDHLKRSEGLFSRGTKASSVLQWIEKCMVKTSWWIHIQSSSETLPVLPTPPATPRSQLCDGTTEFCATSSNFTGFSTCGSLMEIVSPTAEDHIIDCALLFKSIKDDGQLMLLSSSTTLRIKAMAEGLRCETPKEFRESLVNPFSKRFLWTDSSPRGSTWSCFEEVSPSDNCFQQFPALRTTRGSTKTAGTVKGLKLILLHNSHYGAIY